MKRVKEIEQQRRQERRRNNIGRMEVKDAGGLEQKEGRIKKRKMKLEYYKKVRRKRQA